MQCRNLVLKGKTAEENAGQTKWPFTYNSVVAWLTVLVALIVSINIGQAQTQGGTVIGWGAGTNYGYQWPNFGQIVIPASATIGVKAISAGEFYSLALKNDGTVIGWGRNDFGQQNIPSGLTNVTSIAAGWSHCLALNADGTVVGWGGGQNYFGQATPPVGLSNVIAIAASKDEMFAHSLALKSDGTVVAWGDNQSGELNTPDGLTNVVAISAGWLFSLALRSDGTVIGWGNNDSGQITIPPGLSNVVAIEAGGDQGYPFSLALKGNGTVVGWGNNSYGQLDLPLGLSNVVAIAGGGYSALALKADGTAIGWGYDAFGQSSGALSFTNISAIAAGSLHSLAIENDGSKLTARQPSLFLPYSGHDVYLSPGVIGTPPLNMQWISQGFSLPGDTNSSLLLTNVQPNLNGIYELAATNAYGVSSNFYVTLTVVTSAPVVLSISSNQIVPLGSNVTFTVVADGSWPLGWQWRFNQTNIVDATNAFQTLTNIQLPQAGAYDVVVQNNYGATISPGANLDVFDLGRALNETNLAWDTGGDASWFVETATAVDAVALQSGSIGNGAQSKLYTSLIGPATLTLWWRISSEPSNDYLAFIDNSTELARISGEVTWQQTTNFYLGKGTNNLNWVYSKNSSFSSGYDAAWLDLVAVNYGGTAPIITKQPISLAKNACTNVTFSAAAVGTPPLSYQWLFNGSPISGANGTSFSIINIQDPNAGNYSLLVANEYGTNISSAASLTVLPVVPSIIIQPSNTTVMPGGVVTLSTAAFGSLPISFQWTFGGTNIPNATNANFSLNDVQVANSGKYRVIVTNNYGSITSSIATLTVSTVVAWNVNNYGQATVPYNLGSATAIAGSQYNSLAVLTNGTIAAWGLGNSGSTNIPGTLTNVVKAAFSDSLGLAIKNDGTLGWWGTSTQTNPIPYLSNITAVAASQGNFYMALQSNGTVTSWGANTYHQTNVPPGLTNVIAVAVGDYHSLAIKSDGTVAVWGGNLIGNSAQTNIPPGLSNVVAIAGGNAYSLAIRQDGSVVGWPTNEPNVVMTIPAGLSNAVSVAADYQHALALTRDGSVWEWGTVGTGYLTNQIKFSNGIGTAVACGYYHSLANLGNGSPVIIQQPWSQTYFGGNSAFMYAGVVGASPTFYQWQLNGTNVTGATNLLLSLNNVSPTNAGIYTLIASNGLGVAVTSNAALTVITYPPLLTLQPTNRTVIAGSNVTFSVTIGAGPIPNTFQWQFNGTNIIGATNLSLTLTNVQTTNQGNYSVTINNGYGTTTSSNAYLTVIVIDFPTALNTPGWSWATSGSAGWIAQTNTSHDGFEATQSGLIANGQSSTLQTTVTGPGALTFWWMFAPLTSPFRNTLSFSSSLGNASASVTSTTGWQQQTIYLGAGQQTLSWIYSRYSFISAQSTGWVDQVSFKPGSTSPTLTSMSPNSFVRPNANVTFSVGAYGTPPLAYQWQLNGTNLLNKTNAFLSLTGVQPTNSGMYSVIVTNGYGTASTNAALWVGQFALNSSSTNLVFSTNGFRLQLDGVLTTNPVVIYGSTDLVSWLPLFTNSATTGSVQFLDVAATNLPARFYRAQE